LAYRKANVLDRDGTLNDMIGKLATLPLKNAPGTTWEYGVSIDVLGHIVEVVSGKGLGVYFRERIFEPLGMVDTGFFVPKDKLPRFAANYHFAKGTLRVVDPPRSSRFASPPSLRSGGGGLVSTAADYLLFCQMLLNRGSVNGRRVLGRESVDQMTRNQLPSSIKAIRFGPVEIDGLGFGLGVSVWTQGMGPFAAKDEYSWGGAASTTFWISPRDRLIVLTLTQVVPRTNRLDQALRPLVRASLRFGPF
jgi:CubicO group peptidase (beta-lactamase class C family)